MKIKTFCVFENMVGFHKQPLKNKARCVLDVEVKLFQKNQQYVVVGLRQVHCKKRLAIFLSPAGMSLTKLSLVGNYFNIPCKLEFG